MKKLLLFLLVTFIGVGCNGGNGGGAPGYSHNELAEKFVKELNLDPDFDVDLVKSSTLESDFIVVYDPYTGTYDAIDIYSYDPRNGSASDYYYNYSANHYFNLSKIKGHYDYYWEYDSEGELYYAREWIPTRYHGYGLVFEKTQGTPKDLAKMAALKEQHEINKTAQFLASSEGLGLSLTRAKEVARLKANWKKASVKAMTEKELNQFSSELLGFSISEAKRAMESTTQGSSEGLDQLVKKAAKANSITPEHASKLLTKLLTN